MWTLKSTIRLFVSAWLLCLLLACGPTAHAETMYQISESELTELENNLATLESHSQERQKVLTEQATLLDQQREELKKIERGNQQLQSSERRDEEITGECQCILDQVRERGPAQGTGEG